MYREMRRLTPWSLNQTLFCAIRRRREVFEAGRCLRAPWRETAVPLVNWPCQHTAQKQSALSDLLSGNSQPVAQRSLSIDRPGRAFT